MKLFLVLHISNLLFLPLVGMFNKFQHSSEQRLSSIFKIGLSSLHNTAILLTTKSTCAVYPSPLPPKRSKLTFWNVSSLFASGLRTFFCLSTKIQFTSVVFFASKGIRALLRTGTTKKTNSDRKQAHLQAFWSEHIPNYPFLSASQRAKSPFFVRIAPDVYILWRTPKKQRSKSE